MNLWFEEMGRVFRTPTPFPILLDVSVRCVSVHKQGPEVQLIILIKIYLNYVNGMIKNCVLKGGGQKGSKG